MIERHSEKQILVYLFLLAPCWYSSPWIASDLARSCFDRQGQFGLVHTYLGLKALLTALFQRQQKRGWLGVTSAR